MSVHPEILLWYWYSGCTIMMYQQTIFIFNAYGVGISLHSTVPGFTGSYSCSSHFGGWLFIFNPYGVTDRH